MFNIETKIILIKEKRIMLHMKNNNTVQTENVIMIQKITLSSKNSQYCSSRPFTALQTAITKFMKIMAVPFTTYVRSGDTYKPDGAYKQKTIIATRNFTSKFFYGFTADHGALFAALDHRRSALAKSAAALFFCIPLPILQGGLLGEGEPRQFALCLWPTHQQ
jgi:hypothetical protein